MPLPADPRGRKTGRLRARHGQAVSAHAGRPDVRLAEFFVAQPYRRHGVGRAAAQAALAAFHGDWVFEVLDGNETALAFWRMVVPDAEERPGHGDVVFRFRR